MKARSTPWIGAALALAVVFGAPSAFAADNGTPAAATAPAAPHLPPLHHAGDIAYVSGGIGSDQSAAFKDAMSRYPLSLEFAQHTAANGNEYLANVPVTIADSQGKTLVTMKTQGPFMLVSIPEGRYVVTAKHDGTAQQRTIEVGNAGHAHEAFVWSK
jgi:hypothetical protein